MCNPFKVGNELITDKEIKDNWSGLEQQYNWLGDIESRNIFMDTVNSKITGNMLPLIKYTVGDPIYTFFDSQFIDCNIGNNTYMDIGAYTGDTIESFILFIRGKYERVIGIEADKGNFEALSKFVKYSRVPNVEILNIGLWNKVEEREFYTNSINDKVNYDSPNLFQNIDSIADNRSITQVDSKYVHQKIQLSTIDEITKGYSPNIIKVNALAADSQIIEGGSKYIRENKPLIIFEFGVRKQDVFEMLRKIKEINDTYTFYIRRKQVFGDIKTVVYCK